MAKCPRPEPSTAALWSMPISTARHVEPAAIVDELLNVTVLVFFYNDRNGFS